MITALSFTAPWLLAALVTLPVLWLLLRAIPPAPVRLRFPAVTLLLTLKATEVETDRTPWWLLLIRLLAMAALIVGFAGPFWDPDRTAPSDLPLLVVMDGTWAEAPTWTARQNAAVAALDAAGRAGRDVGFVVLTAPEPIQFAPAALIRPRAAAAQPMAWVPGRDSTQTLLADVDRGFETVWIAAPIQYPAQTEIAQAFANVGPVTVIDMGDAAPAALRPARLGDGGNQITVPLIALPTPAPRSFTIQAEGQGPKGGGQVLEEVQITLPTDTAEADARFDLPPELRNRINRFRIAGVRSAGAVSLTGTNLRRREVALIAPGAGQQEGLALLSQLHFVRQALVPSTDLLDAALAQVIQANPDAIILADVARIVEQRAVLDWIENGGILVRFAGPRLAAALFEADTDDPLLPVRLRAGGRTVGGAMSWGAPKTLHPFAPDSPFFGLPTPDEVRVTSQVLAEPSPDLADRVIARLTDGTPLVTQRRIGQGRVVLFHVTANTDWSNLPLSGLFVSMLERLSIPASQGLATDPTLQDLSWTLTQELDAFGTLRPVADRTAVTGTTLMATLCRRTTPLGFTWDLRGKCWPAL